MFKQIFSHSCRILRNISAGIVALGAICSLQSCGMVYDDLEECNQGVKLRFIYDYNMEFANAFPSQVDCLTLLIYDGEGAFIGSRTASAPVISDEDYRMNIDLEPGEYQFVAYGGMDCDKSSFHFTNASTRGDVQVPDSLKQLQVAMNADCITSPVGTNLHKLFYGAVSVTVPDGALDYIEATLPMMRDTNDLRIVLQQQNGEEVPDSAFTYRVTADNTLFNYKNDPVPVGTTTFYPWSRGQIQVGENNYGSPTIVAFAQFSLSRLMADASPSPRLIINEVKDGREVLSIPLIPYMLALRNENFVYMSPQEYLDRDNSWEMIFFLDSQFRWLQTTIVINGYTVRINDIEFGD